MQQIARFLLVVLILMPCIGLAKKAEEINFKCIATMPTTSFLLRQESDAVVLTTIHHNGTDFMPLHDGIITPHDLAYLGSAAKLLTLMDERNEFRFPLNKCKIYGEHLLSCAAGETKVFHGTEMQALFLNVSEVTVRSMDQIYKKNNITLSVNIAGFVPVQDISMDYFDNECSFSF